VEGDAQGSGRQVPPHMAAFTGQRGNPYAMDLPPEMVEELPWVSELKRSLKGEWVCRCREGTP